MAIYILELYFWNNILIHTWLPKDLRLGILENKEILNKF